jgi:hypothetical protein
MYKVIWNEASLTIQTADLVISWLLSLHQETLGNSPILVTVEAGEKADSLSIGIGADLSVLSYVAGNGDPPYYISVASERDDESRWFLFGGSMSEYSVRNCVPLEDAWNAMRVFCETGKLADTIQWEEV